MPTSFYEKLANPLGLAVMDLVDYYGKGLIITRINVPVAHRKQGIANRLLRECLVEADRTRTTLWLEILSSGEMSYTDLYDWYSRHGFRDVGGIMRRRPKK